MRKNLASLKAIEIRKVSKNVAKKEILTYMERHKEAYASDISEELGMEIEGGINQTSTKTSSPSTLTAKDLTFIGSVRHFPLVTS